MHALIRKLIISIAFCLAIQGCATPPPEEVCSADWISSRANKAMAEFERDVRPMIRTFRRAARAAENGNIGALLSVRLVNAVTQMGKRMEDSQALRDVRLLGETCNDPDLLLTTFTGFMRDQGAPDQVVEMLESARGLLPAE